MRIVGIDLGERRIGVAAADDRVRVAIPVDTVEVGRDLVETVERIVAEQQADEVVIGLPLSMSGAIGPQAQKALEMVEALRERLGAAVHTWDERLTTVQASRSGAKRAGGQASRDAAAAALLLQAFLDSRR